jgi:hypothetical protein
MCFQAWAISRNLTWGFWARQWAIDFNFGIEILALRRCRSVESVASTCDERWGEH